MPNFLNIDLNGKIETNFFFKHLFFTLFWLTGILLFVFRVDLVLIGKYLDSLSLLKIIIPITYFVFLIFYFFFIKWYYILAFFVYPFLMIFWFIPKTILNVGKVYLFGNYLNSIYSKLTNLKLLFFNIFFFIFSLLFLITIQEKWTRWIAIICMSYFYVIYVYKFLRKSFKQPSLFGTEIEESISSLIKNNTTENSLIIKSIIIQKDDEKLEISSRKDVQIKRTLMTNYAIELLTNRLNSYRGRQAYLVSWFIGAIIFLLYSIIFFWFLNIQLFKIDQSNFLYNGTLPSFDFLYYTLKTITFGDIELVKPLSILTRISEISSFFIIGIFILVVFVSVFLSMNQDKVNDNIKLTTELFKTENSILIEFLKNEYGMEIQTAFSEIKNIDLSLKKLKDIIDKIL